MDRKDCWAIGRFGSGLTPPPKWEDVFEHCRLSSDAARRDETEWAIGHPGPFGAFPAAENGPRRLNNTSIYQHLRK